MARTLLVKSGGEAAVADWQAAFAACAPQFEVRSLADPTVDLATVEYAVVWDPEPGRLASLPNLKVIFGSGAGVDGILADPLLPKHLPIVRCATPGATQRMGEFACWAVLSLMKGARRYALAQAEGRWDDVIPERMAGETVIGIMGLGAMGSRAAEMLLGLGFRVRGWSRSRKALAGVESFTGEAERDAFLAGTDILICLLPATPGTRGILAAPLLARLPRGASLINLARGSHQVLDDILAALDSGQLAEAFLDVFETEPLPATHRAWAHPSVTITPHAASLPPRRERAAYVADCIARFERGETLPNLYDHERGY
ncbi:MAG: glyoxylate/hydroxypyruvate reductase A [Acetobacteraceae bacterium]|nr:glyoxylate/hydroxypyruvate reductase A [Acetobacteraceae bacterium]